VRAGRLSPCADQDLTPSVANTAGSYRGAQESLVSGVVEEGRRPERDFIKHLPFAIGDGGRLGFKSLGYSFWVGQDGGIKQAGASAAKQDILFAVEPSGAISCSMRMRPALTGSILADVFPHLIAADEVSVAHSDIWEISRYFASGAARGKIGLLKTR